MIEVRKKLILSDYVIAKLVEGKTNDDVIGVLKKLSTTQLMKLLYLTILQCVEVEGDNQKSYRNTPFGILDNWIAYLNGPVEDDVYLSLSFLPTIKQSSVRNYKLRDKSDSNDIRQFYFLNDTFDFSDNNELRMKLIRKYELNNQMEWINKGVQEIDITKFPFNDIQKLIWITHSGKLWGMAQHNKDKKMSTDNIHFLKEEKTKIKDALGECLNKNRI